MLIILGLRHGFVALTNQMPSKEANGMGSVEPSKRRALLLENAKYFSHSEVQIGSLAKTRFRLGVVVIA
jgi:hypothetical protein